MTKGNKGLRPELAEFVEAMEAKLAKNDYKTSWEGESLEYLLGRLIDEQRELMKAFRAGHGIDDEAVDVANFCMMIYSKVKEKK